MTGAQGGDFGRPQTEPAGGDDVRDRLTEVLRSAAHVCQHYPCTTCLVISDDALIDGTAGHDGVVTRIEGRPEDIADALLPTVAGLIAQGAADAVNEAADWLAGTGPNGSLPGRSAPDVTSDWISWREDVEDRDSAIHWCQSALRDRAVDLAPSPTAPTPSKEQQPVADNAGDEWRCARCGQIPYVHGLTDSTCVYDPELRPAASPGGQAGRTEALRRLLSDALHPADREARTGDVVDRIVGALAPLLAATTGHEPDAVIQRVLALADEVRRWAVINRDLADRVEGSAVDFHIGMAQAQEAMVKHLRAAVAGTPPDEPDTEVAE